MSNLEQLLERIAVALEKIAGINEAPGETRFPWGDPRVTGLASNPYHWPGGRPETFEQFIRLGRRGIIDKTVETRFIGRGSIEKMDPIFEEYGFGEQWRRS